MRQTIFILLIGFLISCDNGDIEIPSFDFETTIKGCNSYVLYRLNSEETEALILQLESTHLPSEESVTTLPISSTNCNYRIFDGEVTDDYFCSDIPPVLPHVITDWLAIPGEDNHIVINTSSLITDGVISGYEHHITLQNLILEQNGQQIIRESYDFGVFTTGL